MTVPPSFTEESLYCIKYLLEHGWLNDQKQQAELLAAHLSTDFALVKLEADFFTELASKLRDLWPPGEKDGKYPWRDSVPNLAKRLKILWTIRDMKDYTLEQCVSSAQRYLAQYEDNTKYMRILKYFILKQSTIMDKGGRRKLINQSLLADMLDNQVVFEPAFEFEGELV